MHDLLGGKEQADKVMMRLLSLATLGYAITDERVADLREKKESFARLQALDSEVLIEQLSNLYVETSALLPPLEPDLLGEHLIENTLLRKGKVSVVGKELIALAFDATQPPANYQQGVATLVRLAQRRSEAGVRLLEVVLDENRMASLAPVVVGAMPDDTTALRELAADVTQFMYERAKNNVDKALFTPTTWVSGSAPSVAAEAALSATKTPSRSPVNLLQPAPTRSKCPTWQCH